MKGLLNTTVLQLAGINKKRKMYIITILAVLFFFCLNSVVSAQNLDDVLQKLDKLETLNLDDVMQKLDKLETQNLDDVLLKLEKLETLLGKLYPDQKENNRAAQDQRLAVRPEAVEIISNETQASNGQLKFAEKTSPPETQATKSQGNKNPSLKITGFVRPKFSYTPGDDGDASEFKAGKARVKFAGSISSNTSYGIQIDTVRDDVLLDAFLVHKIVPSFSIKAGQFKTPYSTDNLTSAPKVAFINRPYMRKDTSPAFRDMGLQATYKVSKLDFIAAVMNGSGQNTGETNNNKNMAYRVVARVIPQLQLTGNFCTGKNNPNDDIRDEFINVGANGKLKGWEYSGEFARKKHDELIKSAYFAYVAYDWNTPFNRVPILTPGIRVEFSDPDTDTDDDAKSRYTIGLTVQFAKKYADQIMLNYEVRDAETGDVDDVIGIEYQVTF